MFRARLPSTAAHLLLQHLHLGSVRQSAEHDQRRATTTCSAVYGGTETVYASGFSTTGHDSRNFGFVATPSSHYSWQTNGVYADIPDAPYMVQATLTIDGDYVLNLSNATVTPQIYGTVTPSAGNASVTGNTCQAGIAGCDLHDHGHVRSDRDYVHGIAVRLRLHRDRSFIDYRFGRDHGFHRALHGDGRTDLQRLSYESARRIDQAGFHRAPEGGLGRFAAFVLVAILPIAIVGAAPGVAFARTALEFQPRKILSFGNVNVGATSSQQTETMTNLSATTAIVIKGIAVAPPFIEVGNTCGNSIPANGKCSVSIVFKPASAGMIKKKKGLSLSYPRKSAHYIELEGRGVIGPTSTPTVTPTLRRRYADSYGDFDRDPNGNADTEDGTPKPTPTATATATATITATATAYVNRANGYAHPFTGRPVGRGRRSGRRAWWKLSLANSAISSSGAQVFDSGLGSFESVGSMTAARESAAIVELPNNTSLIVGGQSCVPATISSVSGFECTALQTAELYNRNTKTFTLAGSGSGGLMTLARAGASATLIQGSGTCWTGKC